MGAVLLKFIFLNMRILTIGQYIIWYKFWSVICFVCFFALLIFCGFAGLIAIPALFKMTFVFYRQELLLLGE